MNRKFKIGGYLGFTNFRIELGTYDSKPSSSYINRDVIESVKYMYQDVYSNAIITDIITEEVELVGDGGVKNYTRILVDLIVTFRTLDKWIHDHNDLADISVYSKAIRAATYSD